MFGYFITLCMKGLKVKSNSQVYETVNFLSEKFHEFEADRKLKGEIIKSLRGQVLVPHDDL